MLCVKSSTGSSLINSLPFASKRRQMMRGFRALLLCSLAWVLVIEVFLVPSQTPVSPTKLLVGQASPIEQPNESPAKISLNKCLRRTGQPRMASTRKFTFATYTSIKQLQLNFL